MSAARRRERPPGEKLGPAAIAEGHDRTTPVAAGLCIVGTLVFLASHLGWWTLLAGPAYLAAAVMAVMLTRGRGQGLLAVVLATGSIVVLVGLLRLAGLP